MMRAAIRTAVVDMAGLFLRRVLRAVITGLAIAAEGVFYLAHRSLAVC
jgi:hypothetical protein